MVTELGRHGMRSCGTPFVQSHALCADGLRRAPSPRNKPIVCRQEGLVRNEDESTITLDVSHFSDGQAPTGTSSNSIRSPTEPATVLIAALSNTD